MKENVLEESPKNNVEMLNPGNTVRVHFKIKEGDKTRVQVFEGIVMKTHEKSSNNATITVRRIVSGFGVERIFPLHSPLIEKIEVSKVGKRIRRANISYLRTSTDKKSRIKETVLHEKILINLGKKKVEEVVEVPKEDEVVA